MNSKYLVLVPYLLLMAGVLVAQQPKPGSTTDERRIGQLIKELDDARFLTRQKAEAELLKVGKDAVGPLKKALAGKPSLEATLRMRAILRKLAVRDDSGPASWPLQIRLAVDKKAIKVGDTVKLTTTLFNLSDEDVNVQVGYSTCGNYFECGNAFERLETGAEQKTKKVHARCRVGFCGTGAGPLFVTILAEGSVEYVTEATFGKHGKEPLGYSFGKYKWFSLESPSQAVNRLRVTLAVTPENRNPVVSPKNQKAKYWWGTASSNEVLVQVRPGQAKRFPQSERPK